MLFWLAARGHEVFVLNHYDAETVDGVYGVRLNLRQDISKTLGQAGGVDLFVFNYHEAAAELAALRIPATRAKAMWAGNPFAAHWLLRLDDRQLHRIVCVSHSHLELYRRYPNFSRVEMSYSGIDLDLLDRTPSVDRQEDLVVFLGAPRRTKGFHNLLIAWPQVRQARPQVRLRVIGSAALHDARARVGWTGVLDADLEAEYLDPIVGSSRDFGKLGIEFAGLLPIRDVLRELRRAAVAVVNCNWEGSVETYCRSAIEAQASGTPVVGAAHGSLPEVVRHGETGLLFDEPDPEALAATIVRILSDADLRHRLGRAGRTWARAIGDYNISAADWEGIAGRAVSDEPVRHPRRLLDDLLRLVGYGRARIAARRLIRGATN